MRRYKVTQPTTLTVQAGSVVVLTDQQAAAVRNVIVEVKDKKEVKKKE